MAIERRLTEIAGPVGGRLHTARSRNDQVATDMALFVRAHALRASRRSSALQGVIARSSPSATSTGRCRATRTSSAPSPFTSPTTCSPTSGCSAATPGASSSSLGGTDQLPLGVGRAGRGELRHRPRAGRRASSASPASSPNSIDAVSNRDFVLDFLSAAATCATHLSRLGAEIVLWSSEEFGFAEVSDAWASGSSIMPQKKNPDAAELLRAKAPRVVVAADRAARRPARPAADLQQGHAGGQGGAVRRRRHARALPRRGHRDAVDGIRFDRDRLAGAAGDEMIAATDIADLLVRRGVPFRQSHGIVAGLVARRWTRAARCPSCRWRRSAATPSVLDEEYYDVLSERSWLESKVSEGGTALTRVREQLAHARAELEASRDGERLHAGPSTRAAGRRRSPASSSAAPSRHGPAQRRDRRDRGLPRDRAGLPRARRADAAHARAVRAAGARLRLPLLRHPRAAQRRLRAGGGRRRGADPGAGAARRAGPHARAPRPASAPRTCARARASSPRRSTIELHHNDGDLRDGAGACSGAAPGWEAPGSWSAAHRHHQGGRAAVALLRARLAHVSRPWPPGMRGRGR